MSISVSDPFVATRDRAMPSLVFALDPGVAQQHLERQLPRLAGEDGRVHLQAIRVTRHKPGRRCVIEYDVDVKRPDACLETVVLVGKVRAGRSGKNGYRLLDAFWKAGFQADSPDGISVPEPVGTVPEFQIWLQRKVPGRCAADLLAAPGGVALTVAVIVIDWPKADGFDEDTSVAVLGDLLTTSASAEAVLLARKFGAPE